MGRIVDLQLWEAAQEGASSKSRGCKGEMATLEQVVVNTQRVVDQFAAEVCVCVWSGGGVCRGGGVCTIGVF